MQSADGSPDEPQGDEPFAPSSGSGVGPGYGRDAAGQDADVPREADPDAGRPPEWEFPRRRTQSAAGSGGGDGGAGRGRDGAEPARRRGGLVAGAFAGLVAGASAVAVGEVGAVFFGGAGTAPAVAVGQRAILLAPTAIKEFAIRNFGSHDKSALITGVYILLAVGSALVGVLARRNLTAGSCAAALFGVVGLVAAATQANANVGALIPSLLAGFTAIGVLRWMTRLGEDASDSPSDRRRFVFAVGGTAAASLLGGYGAKAWLDSRYNAAPARAAVKLPPAAEPLPPVPASTRPDVSGLETFFTSNDSFYRVDTALSLPQVDPNTWALRIHGLVDRPVTLTFAELLKIPLIEHDQTLTCVSNPVGGPYCGNARWLGAPLAPLLRQAGIQAGATQILSRSTDGMTIGTPVETVLDGRESLLAVAMNGQALPIEHGFPVRMLVPGLYGYVSATKWVVDLEITTFQAAQGYWVEQGWSQQAPVKTASRIDVPQSGATVPAGDVVLAGTAWATHRGIDAVEVQIDNGPWRVATLATADTPDTWRMWSYRWNDAPKGNHTVSVRATDGTGTVQTSVQQPVVPNGATGYHQITLNVS